MRTLSAWTIAGVWGLALATSSIACIPATDGLGGDLAADTGDIGAEDGDAGDDTSANPNDDNDGDPQQKCEDPQGNDEIGIYLVGEVQELESCEELSFSAKVAVVNVGVYGLVACDCADIDCGGESFELGIQLPDAEWLPELEPGSCHHFRVYTEEVEPGVCRRNRVDISTSEAESPWYSTGSASEDLDHNGLEIMPVAGQACSDACGEWQTRDVMFAAKDTSEILSWGQSAPIGQFEVVNWRSFVTPAGCGHPSVDLTAWTAR